MAFKSSAVRFLSIVLLVLPIGDFSVKSEGGMSIVFYIRRSVKRVSCGFCARFGWLKALCVERVCARDCFTGSIGPSVLIHGTAADL